MSVNLSKDRRFRRNRPYLKFVADHYDYNVFERPDRSLVYLAANDGRPLIHMDDLVLADQWQAWNEGPNYDPYTPWRNIERFDNHLRNVVTDRYALERMIHCGSCSVPEWRDHAHNVQHVGLVCSSCAENYSACTRCSALAADLRYLIEDGEHENPYCGSCIGGYYTHCPTCDGYYDRSRDLHNHAVGEGCCPAPAQEFVVPNVSGEPLSNDTPLAVSIGAGMVSDVGMEEIKSIFWRIGRDIMRTARNESKHPMYSMEWENEGREECSKWQSLGTRLPEIGHKVKAEGGPNFTKRLTRFAHKEFKLKIPDDVVSQVGNLASDHSRGADFTIETTRQLNQSATDFGHPDSCWWQSYFASRCALKNNGGFGIRTYSGKRRAGQRPDGRAWAMPLKRYEVFDFPSSRAFKPTFDAMGAEAFIVFNGYGDLQGYTAARVMCHLTGMSYRKIQLRIAGMYVNGESGYLVGPEDVVKQYADQRLDVDAPQHSTLLQTEQASIEREIVHV